MNALVIAMHSNMNVIIYGLGMDARVPNALGTQTNYGLGMDALICGRSWSINRCIGASLRRSGPGAWHRCISVGATVRRSGPGARHRCIGVWMRARTFQGPGLGTGVSVHRCVHAPFGARGAIPVFSVSLYQCQRTPFGAPGAVPVYRCIGARLFFTTLFAPTLQCHKKL